jgi:hypothetical protein
MTTSTGNRENVSTLTIGDPRKRNHNEGIATLLKSLIKDPRNFLDARAETENPAETRSSNLQQERRDKQSGNKLKRIVCDGVKEFVGLNSTLGAYCKRKGIDIVLSTKHTPNENCLAENAHKR